MKQFMKNVWRAYEKVGMPLVWWVWIPVGYLVNPNGYTARQVWNAYWHYWQTGEDIFKQQ